MEEEIWKALAISGTLAGLAYIGADLATTRIIRLLNVGIWIVVFLVLYLGT